MAKGRVEHGSSGTGSSGDTTGRDAAVLIVEAASSARAETAAALRSAGYEVLECGDGARALVMAAVHRPEAVVLAGGLPGLDATSLLAALKGDEYLADVPVLVVGRRADAEAELLDAFRHDAADYLRPPVIPEELLARLDRAVCCARRERELHRRNVELERATALLQASTRRLERLALVDELTGAYNRRYLVEQGEHLLARAQRTDEPLAALLIDADGFKTVNDVLGHRAGDIVLRDLAASIDRTLRGGDVFGRWGGDEFLVLAPGTDHAGASSLGRRLREISIPVPFPGGGGSLGVSVGCALAGGDGLSGLVHRADAELYAVKSERR